MIARLTFFITLLSSLLLNAAHAEIKPLAQLRQVAAGGSVITVDESLDSYDSELADDFGLFDESTGLAIRTQLGTATADGFAKQVSNITPRSMSAFASADAFVFSTNTEDSAYASTGSIMSLRFLLHNPALFHVQASGFAQNNGTAYFRISDADSNTIVEFDPANGPEIDQVLLLQAGEYGFRAEASASGYFEFGSGQPDGRSEITASITQVPEPGAFALLTFAAFGIAAFARPSSR